MNAFLDTDSPEEMRRQAEQIPMMTDASFRSTLEQLGLRVLEKSLAPDSRFDLRLNLEIKLSWLRHFADESAGQTERPLRTEEDFLNASFESFFAANTPQEMTEAVAQFPYLMAPFMPEILKSAAEASTPEGKSHFEQRLSYLRKITEARTQEWQQAARYGVEIFPDREITGGGLSSEVDKTELTLTMFASTDSYAEMQEVVARYPSLATTEFVSSFALGTVFLPPDQRPRVEQQLNWLRQIIAERAGTE